MKKNKLKALIAIASLISASSTAFVAGACNKTTNKPTPNPSNPNEQKPVSGKINYLAFGDEWSLGQNEKQLNHYNETKKEVYGISYASYIANLINHLKDTKTSLNEYNNFSLANSTLDDWLHLLNPEKYKKNNSIEQTLNYNKKILGEQKTKSLFNNFELKNNEYSFFKSKIKNANLMTFSLGMNDFISQQELLKLIWELTYGIKDVKDAKAYLNKVLDTINKNKENIINKYNALLSEIRKINPNANINLVGYITPFLKLAQLLENKFGENQLEKITSIVNNTLAAIAKNNKVNFFNYQDTNYVKSNVEKLTNGITSPTLNFYGQKKLAQDIFMQMSLNSNDYKNLIDSKNSTNTQALLFNKKSTSIKTEVLGISGSNTNTYKKEYSFEGIKENSDAIKNELQNPYNVNWLAKYQAYFNSGSFNWEKINEFIESILKIYNLKLSDFPTSLAKLQNDLKDSKNKEIFNKLINAFLNNQELNKRINLLNKDIDTLFNSKSPKNVKIDDVWKIIQKDLISNEALFNIASEFFQSEFLNSNENKVKLISFLTSFTKDLFQTNITNKLLPEKLLSPLKNALKNENVKNKLEIMINKTISNIISNPNDYFKKGNTLKEFTYQIINNQKDEFSSLLKEIITWLNENPSEQQKIAKIIKDEIASIYNIKEREEFDYFIDKFLANLNNFEGNVDLLNALIQSSLKAYFNNAETITLGNIFKDLFDSLLKESKENTYNANHKLLFSLVSFVPTNDVDQTKYKNGLKKLGIKQLENDENLKIENIAKWLEPENQATIINIIKDVLNNKDNKLNENGKEFFKYIVNTFIDNGFAEKGFINNLLNLASDFVITKPIVNFLKTNGLEAELTKDNKYTSAEDFTKKLIEEVFKTIKSKSLIDEVKKMLGSIIDNSNKYTFESLPELVSKILANIEENNANVLVETLLKELGNNEKVIDMGIDLLKAYSKVKLDHTINETDTADIKKIAITLLKNMGNTNFYKNFVKFVSSTAKKLVDDKVDSFEKFSNEFNKAILKYFSIKENPKVLQDIFDMFTSNNLNFGSILRIIKAFLDKNKTTEFILEKVNLKQYIEKLNEIKIDETRFDSETIKFIKALIEDTNKFLNENYETQILPLIKEEIKNFIDDESIKAKTVNEWLSHYLEKAKTRIISKINEILKNYLETEKSKDFKEHMAQFLTSLMQHDLKINNLSTDTKQSFENAIKKLIQNASSFQIVEAIANQMFDKTIKILKDQKSDFSNFRMNNIFNINTILKNINYENIEKFVNELESKELKDITLTLLTNIANFSNLFNQKNNKLENNETSQTSLFSEKEELPFESFFKIFKAVLLKLTKEDKKEINDKLTEVFKSLKSDEKFKSFVKEKLQVIKLEILKVNKDSEVFANKIIDKLMNIIFEHDPLSNFITKLLESIINLDEEAFKTNNNFNKLINYLLFQSKNNLQTFIKETISLAIKDEVLIEESISFTLNEINKKYKIDSSSAEQEAIKKLLLRLIKKIGNLEIVENISNALIDKIANIEIIKNNKIQTSTLLTSLVDAIKNIEYASLIKEKNIKELINTALDKSVSKDELKSELMFLYQYLRNNIPKFQASNNKQNKNSANVIDEKEKAFLKRIENLIFEALKALNGSLKENQNGANALKEVVYEILKNEIQKLNLKDIKQEFIDKEKLEKIVNKVLSYSELKEITDLIVDKILAGEKINNTKTTGEFLSKSIETLKDDLKDKIKNVLKKLIKDKDILTILANTIIDYLKLENTNDDDKKLIKGIISGIVDKAIDHEIVDKKLLTRSIEKFKTNINKFDLLNPTKWFNDAINEIKSVFSFSDAFMLADYIGTEENKIINGEKLIKLINLIFGKSKFEDSPLYNGLRNLNSDKKTDMKYLNSVIKEQIGKTFETPKKGDGKDPNNVSAKLDPLKLIDTIFKMLGEEFKKDNDNKSATFKTRANTESYKATYRFLTTLNFILFEMFGRETLENQRDNNSWVNLYKGTRSLMWEIQEGQNLSWIPGVGNKFSGMQKYFDNVRKEFNNYVTKVTGWFGNNYHYYDESNYGPDSITYLINSSGYNEKEKDKLKTFKYKVTENGEANSISKKEYILMTLKEGGFGKFMKLNKVKSNSEWSGLNKVNVEDFA
ncbi:hypothetical protein [Metamycoplasma buccale]|uniref:hypothetical protein n=1 Tax=Metamycoplasma buccale TaxID=55602 RepID=UPI00398ECE0E